MYINTHTHILKTLIYVYHMCIYVYIHLFILVYVISNSQKGILSDISDQIQETRLRDS